MNDIQILTLTLAVGVPFLGVCLGVLLNNNRLTDVRDLLRAEIRTEGSQVRTEFRTEMADLRTEVRTQSAELRTEFRTEMVSMHSLIERHHSEIMSKLIEMDNRILRLESQRLVQ
jgi:hypothetical protein